MSIDKEFAPIEAGWIKATFTEVINKTLSMLMMLEMHRIKKDTKLTSARPLTYDEERRAMADFLRSEKVRIYLVERLREIMKTKSDIIKEIMTQYAIEKGEYASFDHDIMCTIFEAEAEKIQDSINKGNYEQLYRKTH